MRYNFEQCFRWLMIHEGGFVNHPEDPAGMTNMGITRATLEGYLGREVSEHEMRTLSKDVAKLIYKDVYWDFIEGDDLPSGVDYATFDWAVNSGAVVAAKALQRVVGVADDGIIGPITMAAVQHAYPEEIVEDLKDDREDFYRSLPHFTTFGKGWLRRNEEVYTNSMMLL
jgi:Putative secretion activating protein